VASRKHTLNMRLPQPGFAIRADPVRFEQAVCNLIANALKFTPEGGTIEVEATSEGDTAVISVTDNGVGIQPEMLDSIFDLFTQDEVTLARTKGGLGIGLTLAKRLVELHGGSIRAFSQGLGHGSRFELRLPLDRSAPEKALQRSEPSDAQPKRVLVIED